MSLPEMPKPWTLILAVGDGDPNRRVGGLSLALRLALDAQRGGATSLVIEGADVAQLHELRDARLHLARLDAAPANQAAVVVPAHALLHRQSFALLALDQAEAGTRRTLAALAPNSEVPYWFDPILVSDGPSASHAEGLLFRSLRKREDGWTSRWLNRYISLSISRFLAKTTLQPNHLSVAILAIGLLGAYLATRGSYSMMLWGAFLFQMQSVLDGCDGELSRVTHRGSYLGEWLDTVGDDLTNYSFFAGASIGLYRQSSSPLFLVAGGVVVLSGLLTSGLEYRYLLSIHSGDLLKYPLSQATTNQSGAFGAIAPLFKRDTFVFLTLLAAAANLLAVTLVAFAVAALGILISVLATERRLLHERKAKRVA
ncbi:MAG TPA: CDP-alcohol phosphatidyltransferase family protein [Polyangiaceae bacterium]|nr:CDP-alcohol phosphatidyltransferase family protein [Polyangiaceae bacterium]